MPLLPLGVVAIEKGPFWSPSTKVTNFTYIYIYIYIYIYMKMYRYEKKKAKEKSSPPKKNNNQKIQDLQKMILFIVIVVLF